MKILTLLLSLIFISTCISAQEGWIPLEAEKTSENSGQKIKITKLQPINNLLGNVKVIQQLLDKKGSKKETDTHSEKNWYVIKNMEYN